MTSRNSFSLKIFIIIALIFSSSVEARAKKVEPEKSPYDKIANSYLKSFDIEEMDSSSDEEKKLDIEHEALTGYDSQRLALGVLSSIHERPNEIINESLWKDLDLFCGAGENTGAHLLSKVDRTSTVFGRAYLAKMLASPTADINALRKRQNVVKELLNNRSLYHTLNHELAGLKRADEGMLSFWTGKDKDNEKFIDKAVYYNLGLLRGWNKSTKALEFSTRFQQAGTLLACSIYPMVHFGIRQAINLEILDRKRSPLGKELLARFMKIRPDLFFEESSVKLLEEHPEFADDYDTQLEELKEDEKTREYFNADKLRKIEASIGVSEAEEYSELSKKDPKLVEQAEELSAELAKKYERRLELQLRNMHRLVSQSSVEDKEAEKVSRTEELVKKNKEDACKEFDERAKDFSKDNPDVLKQQRAFCEKYPRVIDYITEKFDDLENIDEKKHAYYKGRGVYVEGDDGKKELFDWCPKLLEKYPALALKKLEKWRLSYGIEKMLFTGYKSGKWGEKAKTWYHTLVNTAKHTLLTTPQSIKDVVSLKNERWIVNGLLGKDERGIDRKMYLPVAGLELGLIAFSAFMAYKTIPPQREAIEIANYLQARLTAVADYLRGMRSVGQSVFSNKVLRNKLSLNGEMLSLFDKRSRKSKELDKLIELLSTSTFKGEASFFSWTGRVLAAYKLMLESKDEFTEAFEAIGEVDAHMSIAKLHKEYNGQRATFSFPTYDDRGIPYVSLKEFWNPFISADTVVKNSIELGGANSANVILTGPNAGGKSTVLKAMTINLLLAQTLGIASCEEMTLTPFSKINTYLNITDDIAAGNSLFKSEVLRAQKLLKVIKSLGHGELSFTIMDEIFSGTSPKEGEAASYTVSKSLGKHKKSMCLVATHFPKLTNLEEDTNGTFKNYKVSVVKNPDGTLTYPYNLEEGKTDQNIAFDILANEGVLDEFELSEAQSMLEDAKA